MTTDSDQQFDQDSLVTDIRNFVQSLEEAHPDPYEAHGGRVAFNRHVADLITATPTDGESLRRFHERLQAFAASIADGHTAIQPPGDESESTLHLPFTFRVIEDHLVVTGVYKESLGDLLGGRLTAINDVPIAKLLEAHSGVASADNRYGRLHGLANSLETSRTVLDRLLEDADPPVSVSTAFPDGSNRTRDVQLTTGETPVTTLDEGLFHPETNGEPAYRLLDNGRTALLRLPDSVSYREHHELSAATARDSDAIAPPREAYRRLVGEPVPDITEEVIAGLPAASEILERLGEDMDSAGTESLIVDVRTNTGGSSVLAYLLVYALYGWDGVVEVLGDQYDVGKHSPLYREQFGECGPLGDADTPGGFDFDSYFASPEGKAAMVREQFTELSETLGAVFESGSLEGYSTPENVVVVTDAATFSAGLEPAVLLSKLGADVVGVPPRQSPNGPRDVLLDELPNTELDYHVSYRYHVFMPGDEGDVLDVDVELTYEDFWGRECPADAAVRLALDHVPGNAAQAIEE